MRSKSIILTISILTIAWFPKGGFAQCVTSDITQDQGFITSPHYPRSYGHGASCNVTINVYEWHRIHLTFASLFRLEPCCVSLKLYELDRRTGQYNLSKTWSGMKQPKPYVTNSSSIRLIFKSDSGNSYPGFNVSWTANIGQRLILDSAQGNFSSPGYGDKYPSDLDYDWVIKGRENHTVDLKFHSGFDIESSNDGRCTYDFIDVLESTTSGKLVSRGRFCGTQPPPMVISSSEEVVVRFHTDQCKHGKGFSASWEITCGGIYTTPQGNVTSPAFPATYPNSTDCRWLIQVPDGQLIHLAFQEPFSLEDNSKCDTDYLELYDYNTSGDLVKKGRWCGQRLPPLHTSTTSRMLLVFHSDSSKNYNGFQASWDSGKIWTCGKNFNQARGHLTSPNYPLAYPEYQDCRWEISPTPDAADDVTLHFDSLFEIEESRGCVYDYLEIHRDESVLGRWCGTDVPPDVPSNGHTLVVIFKSDKSGSGRGFFASWG